MSNPFFERPIVNSPYEYPRQPFSWKALGVDIRGRSKTLRRGCHGL